MGRIREALFSIWGPAVEGKAFLDLFCGSGGMGFEALSRGASRVLGVDRDARALRLAERNAQSLGVGEATHWLKGELPAALASRRMPAGETFDFVFADPPYAMNQDPDLIRGLAPWVRTGTRIAIEHDSRNVAAQGSTPIRWQETRRWGDSSVSFFLVGGSEEKAELLEVNAQIDVP